MLYLVGLKSLNVGGALAGSSEGRATKKKLVILHYADLQMKGEHLFNSGREQ